MWIKSITLQNFQIHAHFEANFSKEMNIIVGEGDLGKSTIARAIKWVCFGEPKGDCVRKEGTKKTSVKLTRENGTTVERIKSASVNAYVLKIEGEEEQRFDTIGRDIPEEVREALGVNSFEVDGENIILNVANQISMPFLMDKSGTFRMKLFNQLTGNDVIDKVFKSFNKDILRSGKEFKLEESHLEETQIKLEEVSAKKKMLSEQYEGFKTSYERVKEIIKKVEFFSRYVTRLKELKIKQEESDKVLSKLKTIKKETFNNIKEKLASYDKLKISFDKLQNLTIDKEKIKPIIIPEIDIQELKNNILKISTLTAIQRKATKLKTQLKDSEESYQKLSLEQEIKEKEYTDTLSKCEICPTCKKPIGENCK